MQELGLQVETPDGNRLITLTLITFQADNQAKDILLNKETDSCPACEQEKCSWHSYRPCV